MTANLHFSHRERGWVVLDQPQRVRLARVPRLVFDTALSNTPFECERQVNRELRSSTYSALRLGVLVLELERMVG